VAIDGLLGEPIFFDISLIKQLIKKQLTNNYKLSTKSFVGLCSVAFSASVVP
jgi:hypothetical protein